VLNATFNNISVISWRSVLLMGKPEKTTDLSQVYVKIWRGGSEPMSICEVEVYTVTGLDVWNIQIRKT
jgi:hypothetical protein